MFNRGNSFILLLVFLVLGRSVISNLKKNQQKIPELKRKTKKKQKTELVIKIEFEEIGFLAMSIPSFIMFCLFVGCCCFFMVIMATGYKSQRIKKRRNKRNKNSVSLFRLWMCLKITTQTRILHFERTMACFVSRGCFFLFFFLKGRKRM